jgi:hypothetical protein
MLAGKQAIAKLAIKTRCRLKADVEPVHEKRDMALLLIWNVRRKIVGNVAQQRLKSVGITHFLPAADAGQIFLDLTYVTE